MNEIINSSTPGYPQEASFDEEDEPIYVVIVTGKDASRLPLARNAILSFLHQNYGNRYLLVVNDGPFSFDLPELPPGRFEEIRPTGRQRLGALRNHGLDAVPVGAIWVHGDDDDWRHPACLRLQHVYMRAASVDGCFLRWQVKYDFQRNAAWIDYHPGGFAGTLMARRSTQLRYPDDWYRSEDSFVAHAIKQRHSWYAWDNPPRYFLRFLHADSTWSDRNDRYADNPAGIWKLPRRSAEYLASVLDEHHWSE